jgi:hypothetical protein
MLLLCHHGIVLDVRIESAGGRFLPEFVVRVFSWSPVGGLPISHKHDMRTDVGSTMYNRMLNRSEMRGVLYQKLVEAVLCRAAALHGSTCL